MLYFVDFDYWRFRVSLFATLHLWNYSSYIQFWFSLLHGRDLTQIILLFSGDFDLTGVTFLFSQDFDLTRIILPFFHAFDLLWIIFPFRQILI